MLLDLKKPKEALEVLDQGTDPAFAARLDASALRVLRAKEAAGLLPCGVGQAAATAYRSLRRVQHRARLDEAPTHFPQSELATERAAVLALWNSVFSIPAT